MSELYLYWDYKYLIRSSRSSFSRSVVSRLEDIRRPRGSSQTPNCSENESSVSVKCHPKPSREQSNRSTCCSFGLHNSSHFRNPCAVADEGMSSAQQHTPQRSSTSDCLLRIPAGRRKRPLVVYDLLSCEGSTLRLVCEVNVSCSDQGVSWKKEGRTFAGRELRLQNVQRKDSGTYLCEVMDYYGRPRLGAQVTVAVQCKTICNSYTIT
ncbi:hypothetical protein TNCT_331851 [Trichonephila clavata]|uniref:Ig-like domain-containing protein n=1 Tax=Trichonephila clavata TaxID=2740835 RepID=A0A8X6GPU8_TRICU|nr:hypothetical protein TNCT_331851 [Trichonephila clavata]